MIIVLIAVDEMTPTTVRRLQLAPADMADARIDVRSARSRAGSRRTVKNAWSTDTNPLLRRSCSQTGSSPICMPCGGFMGPHLALWRFHCGLSNVCGGAKRLQTLGTPFVVRAGVVSHASHHRTHGDSATAQYIFPTLSVRCPEAIMGADPSKRPSCDPWAKASRGCRSAGRRRQPIPFARHPVELSGRAGCGWRDQWTTGRQAREAPSGARWILVVTPSARRFIASQSHLTDAQCAQVGSSPVSDRVLSVRQPWSS